MFRITMLPARHGDCLWVEYGSAQQPHCFLIDGGPPGTYPALRQQVLRLPPARRELELLVVTHVDLDHIGGILKLLEDESLGLRVREIWFNGWRHLVRSERDVLGPVHGEQLTNLIETRRLAWNASLGGRAVAVPADEPLPIVTLPGGLRIVLLSPTPQQLRDLRPIWEPVVLAAGLDPDKPVGESEQEDSTPTRDVLGGETQPNVKRLAAATFHEDDAEPNGSSIAFFAEYEGRRCLFAGDAHPSTLKDHAARYVRENRGAKAATDAIKLSHHGSRKSTSPDLITLLEAKKYLFSTDGSGKPKHPHQETVARVLVEGGPGSMLFFNYRSASSEVWDDRELCDLYQYQAVYPVDSAQGLVVDL